VNASPIALLFRTAAVLGLLIANQSGGAAQQGGAQAGGGTGNNAYSWTVYARSGQTIDGHRVSFVNGRSNYAPSMNASGDIAFRALTATGAVIFLNKKVAVRQGMRISGRIVGDPLKPSINRRGHLAYAFSQLPPYQGASAFLVYHYGVVVNGKVVLASGQHVAGCGTLLVFDNALINDRDSYAVTVRTVEHKKCLIIDGRSVLTSGMRVSGVEVQDDLEVLSYTNSGEVVYHASRRERTPDGGDRYAEYVCNLKSCRRVPDPIHERVVRPLVNDAGQIVFGVVFLIRGDNFTYLNNTTASNFALNGRGEVFTSRLELLRYDEATTEMRPEDDPFRARAVILTDSALRHLFGLPPYDLARLGGDPEVEGLAIDDSGRVAAFVRFEEAWDALIIGKPRTAHSTVAAAVAPNAPNAPAAGDPIALSSRDRDASVVADSQGFADARAVRGVAADGVARIVLRIPTAAAGERVTVDVVSDRCGSLRVPATCTPSASVAEDGGLASIDQLAQPLDDAAALSSHLTGVRSVAVPGKSVPYAFAVYRAPVDFVRKSHLRERASDVLAGTPPLTRLHCDDCAAKSRPIALKITSADASVRYVELDIVRPPVMLVHGFNDDRSGWQHVHPRLLADGPAFAVYRANYGQRFADSACHVSASSPTFLGPMHLTSVEPLTKGFENARKLEPVMTLSHFGFTFVAPMVRDQMLEVLEAGISSRAPCVAKILSGRLGFRFGDNPIHAPVAAIQFDVVAHSMGGLVARQIATDPDNRSATTFGRGMIHKLVTLGTPHLGTPQAILALAPDSGCSRRVSALGWDVRNLGSPVVNVDTFVVDGALGDRGRVRGAVGEMKGNGIGIVAGITDRQLAELATSSPLGLVPTAFIAGKMGSALNDADILAAMSLLRWDCPNDRFFDRFSRNRYATIFDPNVSSGGSLTPTESDGSVPFTSALPSSTTGLALAGYVHSYGIFRLTGKMTPHYLLDGAAPIPEYVRNLLDVPVSASVFNLAGKPPS